MKPEAPVPLEPVDIGAWAAGNTGIPYVTAFDGGSPGPHAVITALMHGNELCGAHALAFLHRIGIRPKRGRLSLCFANVAAYASFDRGKPTTARYLEEDMNRVWSADVLDGPRRSVELDRARELRPLMDSADFLLDIHSMQLSSPPLMLCGMQRKGREMAERVGCPRFIVSDAGHASGTRLRDYGRFADESLPNTALLVECGQHVDPLSRTVAIETALRFLLALDLVDAASVRPHLPPGPPLPPELIEVTAAVTIDNDEFGFTEDFVGLEVIPAAGTVIAHMGDRPVQTPYDNCVLIMPTRRLRRGQTAVRFGRFVA